MQLHAFNIKVIQKYIPRVLPGKYPTKHRNTFSVEPLIKKIHALKIPIVKISDMKAARYLCIIT